MKDIKKKTEPRCEKAPLRWGGGGNYAAVQNTGAAIAISISVELNIIIVISLVALMSSSAYGIFLPSMHSVQI